MDANRITRFTVAGWAFLIAWFLQLWILGYNFTPILQSISNAQSLPAGVGAVLVGVAAGPILGFVFSTFSFAALRYIRGGEPEFDVPEGDEFNRYSKSLKALLPTERRQLDELLRIVETNNIRGSWQQDRRRKKEVDALIPYFNLLFHSRAPSTLIDYASRRWTIYWMSVNSICSTILGILFALLTFISSWNCPISCVFSFRRVVQLCFPEILSDVYFWNPLSLSVLNLHFVVQIVLLLFIYFAFRRTETVPKEISQSAWLWLNDECRQSKEKKRK